MNLLKDATKSFREHNEFPEPSTQMPNESMPRPSSSTFVTLMSFEPDNPSTQTEQMMLKSGGEACHGLEEEAGR